MIILYYIGCNNIYAVRNFTTYLYNNYYKITYRVFEMYIDCCDFLPYLITCTLTSRGYIFYIKIDPHIVTEQNARQFFKIIFQQHRKLAIYP